MGLIDLKSNLTSLKYEKDQLGGGSSRQPYIQIPPPEQADIAQKIAISAARFGYDFPIRGGFAVASSTATDLLRIGKFLFDPSRGPLFIAKQTLLQLTNPKIETNVVGIENTRIYNLGLNTLTQVGVNAFGIHFPRAGLFPTLEDNYYFKTVNQQNIDNDYKDNRLYLLYDNKILGNSSSGLNKGISPNPNQIISYLGGPNSFLGIGRTNIGRYTNTKNNQTIVNSNIGTNNFALNSYEELSKKSSAKNNFGATAQDFRKDILNQNNTETFLTFTNYLNPKINAETRIGIGNPGKPSRKRNKYSISDPQTQDQINMLPLVNIINGKFQNGQDIETNTLGRDLIKFRFEAINNDNASETVGIFFRAYITGINDNFSPEWNNFKYNGRGEHFYVYEGFRRQISFKLKIAAQSRSEMKPLYQKLNYLASNLTPDYKGTFMRGPFMLLTIGDYIWRQPGFINSLDISIPDEAPWEIALNEPELGQDDKIMN